MAFDLTVQIKVLWRRTPDNKFCFLNENVTPQGLSYELNNVANKKIQAVKKLIRSAYITATFTL